jgi:hypothetical protein
VNQQTQSERLSTADLAYGSNQPSKEHVDEIDGQMNRPTDTAQGTFKPADGKDTPLFPDQETIGYRSRWDQIQTSFVDEPHKAVEQADALVAETMKKLAEMFAHEHENLEHQWNKGDQASTEDLRMVLQRYRSFFDRLLTV